MSLKRNTPWLCYNFSEREINEFHVCRVREQQKLKTLKSQEQIEASTAIPDENKKPKQVKYKIR